MPSTVATFTALPIFKKLKRVGQLVSECMVQLYGLHSILIVLLRFAIYAAIRVTAVASFLAGKMLFV